MEIFYYSEIELICFAVLFIMLYRIVKSHNNQNRTHIFSQIIGAALLFICADLFWGFITMGYIPKTRFLMYAFNVIYYLLASNLCCLWLYYSETFVEPKWLNFSKKNLVFLIPSFSLLVLMIISCFTGITFYVDDNMEYGRGPLYILQLIFAYYPLLVSCMRAHRLAAKKENYAVKNQLMVLGYFPIFALLFGMIQIHFVDLPILCVGIALGVLVVYLNETSEKISIDALTQINNRNQLIQNLNREMNDEKNRESLYLFMIDADYFKQINDEYGHAEGDKALILIANALKKVASHRDCSIYRFGGDEFILLIHAEYAFAAEKIRDDIKKEIDEMNGTSGKQYKVSVSVGFAKYNENTATIPDFISAADAELYKIKKAR